MAKKILFFKASIWLFAFMAIAFFIALSISVCAVSISPSKYEIEFAPNTTEQFEFKIGNADSIETFLSGELAPYTKITDSKPKGGPRTITAVLSFPETIPPGRQSVLIGAIESSPEGATVGGRAAVKAPIYVNVPYEGIYIEAGLSAPNINIGEKQKFKISVSNKGLMAVNALSAVVYVFDSAGAKIAEISTLPISLGAKSSVVIDADWDSSNAKAGAYNATAIISYDGGKTIEKNANFKIGQLEIFIRSYTNQFETAAISPFSIDVESGWNSEIKDVYGEISFAGNIFKTNNFDISDWQKKSLTGYVDARQIPIGEYPAKFIVYYADKTTKKDDIVKIIAAQKQKELPEKGIGLGTIVVIALAVLIAIAAFVVFYKSKKE